MLIDVEHSQAEIYQALFELSQSIADHSDLESLCEGLAQALRRIVEFERFALMLHDPEANIMRVHGVVEGHTATREVELTLPLERTPAGWVLTNQQPLMIPNLQRETRWPEFIGILCSKQLVSLTLVPLTTGNRRLGVLGFGGNAEYSISATELAFMQRVASEFAVSVESYLMRQKLVHERDRLRALFEITNALVSKLSPAELFPAISEEMSRVHRARQRRSHAAEPENRRDRALRLPLLRQRAHAGGTQVGGSGRAADGRSARYRTARGSQRT